MKKHPSASMTIQIDAAKRKELQQIAVRSGQTLSSLTRMILYERIEDEKLKKAA
jgi:predicted transcriptional regulator